MKLGMLFLFLSSFSYGQLPDMPVSGEKITIGPKALANCFSFGYDGEYVGRSPDASGRLEYHHVDGVAIIRPVNGREWYLEVFKEDEDKYVAVNSSRNLVYFGLRPICGQWLGIYAPAGGCNGMTISGDCTLVNAPPTISNVNVSGSVEVFSELIVTYTYSDAENDAEEGTLFQWYADGVLISDATSSIYIPSVDDLGKSLKAVVTPRDVNHQFRPINYYQNGGLEQNTEVTVGTVNCEAGFTCETQNVSVCDSDIYQVPNGSLISENGSYETTSGTVKTYYNVTFDRIDTTPDIFLNAVIAESGSVTYQANTNATGVLSFDKTQDYWVDLNALQNDLNATSRSIFMWIKSEANVTSGEQILFGINPANNGNTITNLFIDDNGDNLETNDGGSNRNASFDVSGEVWNHVGYTYDVNTNETVIYVNGISQITYTNDQSTTPTSRYSLGQEFDANESNHYNGEMAEVSVWNEALTGSEIRQAMKEKITNVHPKFANLVGYYSVFGACDDDTSLLIDHSGKGNDGVMQNGFTQDFKNVESIDGFNAVDWYENLSWKKNGTEVSTVNEFTTNVAAGSYEFTATRNFIKSTDSWTMTANNNASTVDNLADETFCAANAITRTTTDINKVNYLDFEEDDKTGIEINSLTDNLISKDRSVFMWVNKESSVGSNDVFSLVTFNGFEVENDISRLFIRSDEKLNIWDGDTRLGGTTALQNDTWYHVGYTYNATTFETKLYVNGVLENTGTREMPLAEGHFASLGNSYIDNGRDDFLDGKMADVTVWDKLLTEAEITSIMGAAPAHNATNLVGAYGTLRSVADNRLFDLTANDNNGVASQSSIFVSDTEETISNYDASNNYLFSWKKAGTEFDTDATGNITIDEGTITHGVQYGTPFFQKTDAFGLSYTNLLPSQPVAKTAGVGGSVTFEVDNIAGASYQWYERREAWTSTTEGENGFPTNNGVISVFAAGDNVYAGTASGGLAISVDGGATWSGPISGESGYAESTSASSIYADNGKIYVATNGGLSISSDNGTTWNTIGLGENGLSTSNQLNGVFAEGEKIYVTVFGRGLYISTDGGDSFSSVSSGQNGFAESNNVRGVFAEGNNIYVATDAGISISNNGGSTWTTVIFGQSGFANGTAMIAVFADGNKVYAAISGGLSISQDGGVTWTTTTSGQNGFANSEFVRTVYAEGNNVYAGTTQGLSVSTDGGATWSTVTSGDEGLGGSSYVNSVYVAGGKVYAALDNGRLSIFQDRILLSDNTDDSATNQIQGATTHQLTINNLSLDQSASEYFVVVTKGDCSQTSNDVSLTVLEAPLLSNFTPVNGSTDVSITTGFELFYQDPLSNLTDPRGSLRIFEYDTDLEKISSPLLSVFQKKVSIPEGTFTLDYDTKYYVLLDAGLVKDSDGNPSLAVTDKDFWTFTTACEPLITTQPTDQSAGVGGSATFEVPEVTGATYQWFKKEEGSWTTTTSGENGFANSSSVSSVYAEGDKVYAGTQLGLSISTDGGLNWTTTTSGQNGFANSNSVLSVSAEGDKVYAGTDGGFSISTDGGLNWITTTANQNGFAASDHVLSVYVASDKVYVGTQSGLSISTDGGLNWTTTTASHNGFANNYVASVYAEGDKVYAGTQGGISISTDGGLNWTNTENGQNGLVSHSVVVSVYAKGDKVYVGTDGGFSTSTDGGLNWATIAPGQNGFANVSFISSLYGEGDKVYAGTEGGLSISTDGGLTWTTTTSEQSGFANSNFVSSVSVAGNKVYAGTGGGLSIFSSDVLLSNEPDNTATNQIQGATTHQLTINNLTLDTNNTEYFVKVAKGTCEEVSNTVSLAVKEFLTILFLTPANNAVEVATDTKLTLELQGISSSIGIRLSDNIAIKVRRVSDDIVVFESLDGTGVTFDLSDAVRFHFETQNSLEPGTTYYVEIGEDTFISNDDTKVFPGIHDKTTWTFTTACEPLITTQPTDQSGAVGASATFSVPVINGASYQWFQQLEPKWNTITGGQNGFANTNFISSIYVEGNTIYVGTSGSGLSFSRDGGNTWSTVTLNENGFSSSNWVRGLSVEGDNIYVATVNSSDGGGGVSISRDGGLTWATIPAGEIDGSSSNQVRNLFTEGGKIYADTNFSLSMSDDGGETWISLTDDEEEFPLGAARNIRAVYVVGDIIYVGTQIGLFISNDGGITWTITESNQNGFVNTSFINDIHVEGNKVYVSTSAGLAISNNGGATWTTVVDGENGFASTSFVVNVFAEGNKVYAGTNSGLSISEDGGATWTVITKNQNGFANDDFVSDFYAIGDQLYAATSSGGISIFTDRTLLADEPDNAVSNQIQGATTRELTINNLTEDFNQTEYLLVVTKGNCEETSNTVTLTISVGAPVITTLSPADDEEEVARFTSPAITFDKVISKGTGNIEVRRASDDQLLTTIGANSVLVSISDKTATIKLGDTRFEFGTAYYITIPEGAFNSTDGGVFEGISDKTTWSFTIIDAPAIVTSTPADDAIDVDSGINEAGIDNAFSFVFNQNMQFGIGGNFDLYKADGDELVGSTVNTGSNNFSIKVADDNRTVRMFFVEPSDAPSFTEQAAAIALEPGTEYYILTSGIPFFNFDITDITEWSFTTEQPELLVSSLTPADDATALHSGDLNAGLPTSPTFQVTFDQPIEYNNTNASFELYTASDDQLAATQTLASTISGAAIGDFSTLNFAFASYEFRTGTEYYILIDAGIIKSKATGAEFAGITDKTTWSFATAADPFTYTNLLPSTQFSTGEEVQLNLNEPGTSFIPGHIITFSGLGYTEGNTGKLGLYSSADDALVYEIDLATDPIVFNPDGIENFGKVSIFSFDGENTLMTITDEVLLNSNTQYYWLVDEGILLNSEGGRFAGISDKTDWGFTTKTVEVAPLDLFNVFPLADEPLDLGRNSVRLTFNENIVAGTGTLTIFKGSDDSVFETFNVSDLSIRYAGAIRGVRTYSATVNISQPFELAETYYVQFSEGFIKNEDGTKSVAAIDDKTTFSFGTTLADAIFEEFSPAPGSTTYDVSKGSDFEIVTSEDITEDELEPIGGIRIYQASDNTLVKTIEYDGENDGDLDYPGEDDELAIEFSRNELEPDTEYYVLIDDGFIVSYDEPRYHAGISSPDTWRFRTAALPTEPEIVSTNPINNTIGISASQSIQITFSENIRINTGNVVLHDASGTVFETIPVSVIGISATQATITPTNNLDFSTTYYVLIEATAFESSNGVAFAGITSENTLRFTTEAMPNTAPVASAQSFNGSLEVNQSLTGSYDYSDADTDPEDGSVYQWFMADDASGNNASAISGATAQNFTLTANEEGKFVALAVIPFDGEDAGTEVFTNYQGPVAAAVIPTLVSTLPLDGAVDIATNTNLSFVLSESVTKGTGSIKVTTTGGSQTVFNVTSAEVTVSGVNVTIDPSNDLTGSQFYTVTFDASAFVDSDGNNSAGLTSATTWNFTTEQVNVAPVASAVSINKSIIVDGTLQGSYNYSDGNDDPESGTTYQWYRSNDATGTNRAAISGATSESYMAVAADNNKYLSFEVIPNDGTLVGNATESDFFGPVLINDGVTNIPPAFTSDPVITLLDNVNYSYTITTEDANSHTVSLTKTTGPAWLTLSAGVLSGNPSGQVGEHVVVLTADDANGGTVTQEFTVTVEASNTAPSVSGIEVAGTTTIDQILTGSYNFIDAENDADNASYKWYSADDNVGTNKAAITGATASTYTLTTAEAGKFISFEVIPNDSKVDGTLAESIVVGAVAKKIPSLTLTAITKTYGDADFDLTASTNASSAITYAFDNDQTGANLNGSTVTLGNAGTIMVDVSLAEDAEFQARQVQSTITVGKKTVEFTATDANKNIGENDPELTFATTSGAVVGSDVVVTLSREAGEEAGTYAMTFTEGADAANYDISTMDGTFTITQTAISITADAATKTYGKADPDFTFSITSGALASGDELSGIITREGGENVGSHVLQSSLFNNKYNITFVPANLTIGKADLSITVNDQSRSFGEANPEFTLSYNGLANGDTGADFDTPPVATSTATETSASGTYDITLNSPVDGNYNIIGTTNGTLTINQVDIALTISDVTVNEDEGSATITVVLDNAVSGGFTVDASTTDGTATAGTDYTTVTGETLTFSGTAGEEQSFTIALTPEFDEEADEALTVSLSNLLGTTLPIDITDQATVTIANDDVASAQFIITMETTVDIEEINLPTTGSSYNYVVDWGDGSVEGNLTGDKTHTYATAGTYTIRITGDFPRIFFKGAEDGASDANALKLKSIEQWGTNTWSSMNGAFEGAMNMVINATDAPDLSNALSLEEMFSDCDALTNNDFTHWDVSNIISMKEMFERANNFNGDLSNWDVSNVIDMEQMFKDALVFNGDITAWNTEKIEDMNRMFQLSDQSPAGSVMSFNQNIDGWDVSSVADFNSMFEDNTVVNQDFNSWNVSSTKDMEDMFRGATAFNGNISDWDVSSVTSMNGMLADAAAFDQDISKWNVDAVEDMEEMFDGATLFNADIRNWDVSSVTSMKDMFEDAITFNASISGWTTTALTNMEGMFLRASAFNQDISGWDISGLTALERVFEDADAFNQDLSGWNTSAITDMSSLFEEANAFNQDISSWNVGMVTDMGDMFLNAVAFDQSLAAWDMGLADDLEDMLSGSGLSTVNYDATLTSWAAQTLQSGITLGATGLNYCASLADRQSLIDDDTWNINGDSQACETVVTITDIGGVEDDGDITVTLTSSQTIIDGFTIDVSTADGTATASTDYTAVTSQTITFAGNVGETQTFTISPTADSDDEPNETILVNMGNLVVTAGNTVDITDQGTITIFNEDVATAFFTTAWETTVDNQSITIPTNGEGYNYRIDWGDGTIEKNQTDDATHTYATAGTYTVKIVGFFPRIDFGNSNSNNSALLKSVEQWGTIEWQSMENAFRGVANLSINAPGAPNLADVTSMGFMFGFATNMNDDISGWDVSNVTDMRGVFNGATSFNQDISGWDVSQVTDMAVTFSGASAFNQPLDAWNVGKVISMEGMFDNADAFNQDLNSWDVSKVEKFDHMFRNTDVFNANITSWNVSSGSDFEEMFQGTKAFNQLIGNWNLASATNVRYMFQETEVFNQPLNDWRFPNLTSMEAMFRKSVTFNQDLNDWEMTNITRIDDMFEEAEAFNGNISGWDVRNVKNFDYAFDEAVNFNQDISGWDVGRGENFRNMFDEATNFNQDLSTWQMGNGTNFFRMFNSASGFDQDLSLWNVTSATNMSSMLNNSGLSVANYDALLTAWAKQEVQSNVQLGVTGLQYCAGSNGRQSLIDVKDWIIENDGISCISTVTIEDIVAAEDDGDVTVTLTSDRFVADGFTVDVTTADGTATAGEDYTAVTSETVTFFGAAGETQAFTITPVVDDVVELDETLTVSMSNVVTSLGNQVAITDEAVVTLINDDNTVPVVASPIADQEFDEGFITSSVSPAGVFTDADGDNISISVSSSNENVVTVSIDPTNGNIILTEVGTGTATITVTGSDGQGGSVEDTFTVIVHVIPNINLATTSLSLEEGKTSKISLDVNLGIAGSKTITVDYVVTGTATGEGEDYTLSNGTLTFDVGDTQKSISYDIIDDAVVEADETIIVTLSNPTNADLGTNTVFTHTIVNDDVATPTLSFATTSANLDESSTSSASIDINLSASSNSLVTVDYTVTGTATGGGDDYTLANGTLTFATGDIQKSISYDIIDDAVVESDETIIITLSNPTNADLGTNTVFTHTIVNDDVATPTLSFATTSANLDESSTSSVSIDVNLSASSISVVTVDYTVTGTATGGGDDYTLANGTLTFATGDIQKSISYDITDDALVEADETIIITLSNPTNADLGTNTVFTHTIVNDDVATPTLSFATTSVNLDEGSASAVSVDVNLSASSTSLVTVDYTVTGSATGGGDDYTLANGTLTFATGDIQKSISYDITDDALVEADETIIITLSNPTNADLGTNTVFTHTIVNDDVATPTLSFATTSVNLDEGSASAVSVDVNLSASSNSLVTVDYTVTGTATGGGDDYTLANGTLTFATGDIQKSISYDITDDALVEADETIIITLSNPTNADLGTNTVFTHTIVNDDVATPTLSFATTSVNLDEGSASAVSVDVNLSASSNSLVTVDYTVTGTATGGGDDYTLANGTLTFATGDIQKSISYDITDDALVEADETIIITLSNPTNADLGTNTVFTHTIVNDDVTTPTLSFATTSVNLDEGSASAVSVDVNLSASSTNLVTVDYTVTGSATGGGDDYTLANGTLTFATGDIQKSISYDITDDAVVEADETVIITLSNPTNADLGTNTVFTHTIVNDDVTTPTLSFATTSVNLDEGSASTVSIDVNLSASSTSLVTVDYTVTGTATGGGDDYTLANGTLTFATGDTQKSIFYDITDDAVIESDETIIVTLSNPTNADLGTNTVFTHTIVNDDVATPTLSFATTSANLDEGLASSASIDINLSASSTSLVTVDYTVTGTATGGGNDYTLSNGTLTFAEGDTQESIFYDITDDVIVESDETIIITLSNPENADLGANTVFTHTIVNDDVATPTLSFASSTSNGSESVSSASVIVTLSNASTSNVTVDFAVTGTATGSGTDYTLADGTLTFVANDVSEMISITSIVDDALVEGDETVIITLSNPSGANLETNTVHTYTITDNDAAVVTIADVSATEDSGMITITAVLNNAVEGGFTVDVFTTDGTATTSNGDYTPINEALTFVGNPNESQTFTLSLGSDISVEGDEMLNIMMSNLSRPNLPIDISDQAIITLIDDDSESTDTDKDGVLDIDEDLNGNLNLDDDDTDGDGTPNYLDTDDDGDGILTADEDFNRDGNFNNDDNDNDGIPDYLDAATIPDEANIPQGISPDGNGANDIWRLPEIESHPDNKVTIFSRWGRIVYETTGYDNASNAFTGKTNKRSVLGSSILPDGTYYYVIDYGNGEVRKGFLLIKQ